MKKNKNYRIFRIQGFNNINFYLFPSEENNLKESFSDDLSTFPTELEQTVIASRNNEDLITSVRNHLYSPTHSMDSGNTLDNVIGIIFLKSLENSRKFLRRNEF